MNAIEMTRDRVSLDEQAHDRLWRELTASDEKRAERNIRYTALQPELLQAVYENGIPYATCMKLTDAIHKRQIDLALPAIYADVREWLIEEGTLYEH